MSRQKLAWLPNAITLVRCGLALWVGLSILTIGPQLSGHTLGAVFGQGSPRTWLVSFTFILFVITAATDFVDGYLARRWNAVSALGAFLDPIADKILVAASLAALSYISGWAWLLALPMTVIICRDVLVTLARLQSRIALPVSRLAKYKTASELLAIGLLLGVLVINMYFDVADPSLPAGGAGSIGADNLPALFWIGIIALWFAATLAAWTGFLYLRRFAAHYLRAKSTDM